MKPDAYRFDSADQRNKLAEAFPKGYFTFIPKYSSGGFMFDMTNEDCWQVIGGTWSSSSIKAAITKGWNVISYTDAMPKAKQLRQGIIDSVNIDRAKQNNNLTTMNTKIGTLVKCTKSLSSSFLKTGETYKIVSVNQHGNIQVQELGSDPKTSAHWYLPNRFVEVTTPAKTVAVVGKVSLSKKYKTRGGGEVTLYTTSGLGDYPVVGAVKESDGSVSNVEWTAKGEFYKGSTDETYDLVEVIPVPHNIPVYISAGSSSQIAVVYQTYVKFIITNLTFAQVQKVNDAVAEMQKALAANA